MTINYLRIPPVVSLELRGLFITVFKSGEKHGKARFFAVFGFGVPLFSILFHLFYVIAVL